MLSSAARRRRCRRVATSSFPCPVAPSRLLFDMFSNSADHAGTLCRLVKVDSVPRPAHPSPTRWRGWRVPMASAPPTSRWSTAPDARRSHGRGLSTFQPRVSPAPRLRRSPTIVVLLACLTSAVWWAAAVVIGRTGAARRAGRLTGFRTSTTARALFVSTGSAAVQQHRRRGWARHQACRRPPAV